MLDMAFGLTDTSRLGCQVHLTRELDGITCTLPSATRNMFVDGTSSRPTVSGVKRLTDACPACRLQVRSQRTIDLGERALGALFSAGVRRRRQSALRRDSDAYRTSGCGGDMVLR